MATWKGEAVIKIVTPMDAGAPKTRPRSSAQVIEVEAENAEEAEQRIREVIMRSKFPPQADELVIDKITQV